MELGRYSLLRVLGSGGTASVYEAELNGPAGFRKRVALKLLTNELDHSERESLVNEARLGALLRHPHLVDIYELGEVDGKFFIAMELIKGPTLLDLVRRHGAPPPEVALELCRQITRGLICAHGLKVDGKPANLIHRDLKLSNILMDPAGLAKIADFGIARAEITASYQTLSGNVRGSLGYMSPEQMVGETLDQRTDLFSLGVVFYQLVTGTRLIMAKASDPRSYFGKLLTIDSWLLDDQVLDSVRTRIPGMDHLLIKMLRKDRNSRIESAVSVRRTLNQLRAIDDSRLNIAMWLEGILESEFVPVRALSKEDTQPIVQGEQNLNDAQDPSESSKILPHPTDPFIGREKLVHKLSSELMGDERILLLKGPGGMGKSRLALELAARLEDHFSGGTWYCDLEDLRQKEKLMMAVASGLKFIPEAKDSSSLDAAIRSLLAVRAPCLIILDGIEDAGASLGKLLTPWKEAAPENRWIITSRRSMKLAGQRVEEVGPLPRKEAIALLQSQSEAISAGWSAPVSQAKLKRLVESVDRVPYAIELIAAMAPEYSPEAMLLELEQKASASRKEIIEVTLGWSWRQLEPWERWALAQLSVFQGGFFIDQAEEVVDLSAWPDSPWVVHVVGSLLDKSLLTCSSTDEGPRFDMYRLVAQVAETLLRGKKTHDRRPHDHPELDIKRVQERHALVFGRMGHDTHHDSLHRHGGLTLWNRHKMEVPNLVAAFSRAMTAGRSQDACNATVGLLVIGRATGKERTGLEQVDRLLSEAELSKSARTRMLYWKGSLLRRMGRLDRARVVAEEAATLAREIRVASLLNSIKLTLGGIHRDQGSVDIALRLVQSVVQSARRRGEETLEVRARNHLALTHFNADRNVLAREQYELALKQAIEIGDVFHQAMLQGNLGLCFSALGELQQARRCFGASIEAERRLGNAGGAATHLANLGRLETMQGNHEAAWEALQQAYKDHSRSGMVNHMGMDLLGLGILCMDMDRMEESKEYLDRARVLAKQRRAPMNLALFRILSGYRCMLVAEYPRAQQMLVQARATCQDLGWSLGEGVAMGMLGGICIEHGELERAKILLQQAEERVTRLHRGEDLALIHVFKGRLALRYGRLDEAYTMFSRGIEYRDLAGFTENSGVGQALAGLSKEIERARETQP